MGFWSGTKTALSWMVDVRVDKWIGYDYIKGSFKRTSSSILKTFKPEQAQFSETFEEAMIRLNLTEDDLVQRKKEWTFLCLFFGTAALLLLGYLAYNLSQFYIGSSMIVFGIMIYCLSQVIKFHFWLYQLSQRRLGCTLQEWFASVKKSFGL